MRVSYPAPNTVSVLIGTFNSENDFVQSINGPIRESLGFKKPLVSFCEVAFETEVVPIRILLEGFSGWRSFVDRAEEVANERNLRTANAALVCYYVKCEDAPEIWDNMHFLGSFAGRDVGA